MLNKEEEKPKYTKEYLENIFKDIFKDKRGTRESTADFGWRHDTWEENGQQYSSWTFKGDGLVFTTGDKGKEKFDKLFAESFKDNPKLLK